MKKHILSIMILFFCLFLSLQTCSKADDVIIGTGVIFKSGNVNFTTNHPMHFSSINVVTTPHYLWMNNTRICVTPLSSYVNVELSYLIPHPLVSVSGDKILGFNASKTVGRVWFNFSGLKTNYWYKWRNDTSPYNLIYSNASGGINFSFVSWSTHGFVVYDLGAFSGGVGGGGGSANKRTTSYFIIGLCFGTAAGALILNRKRKKNLG